MRSEHAALAADGFAAELVDGRRAPGACCGARAASGCSRATTRRCSPRAGCARWPPRSRQRGVTLYEGTPAEPPARNGAGWVVRTPGGALRAERVVVAADGALPALVPAYAPRVRTLRLHMVATAPVAEQVLPRPIYARYGFEYAQQRPDGRLAVGGFRDAEGDACYTDREEPSALVQEHLRRYLAEELGVEAPITHGWVGLVGYTEDQRPVRRRGPRPGRALRAGRLLRHGQPQRLRGRPHRRRAGGARAPPPTPTSTTRRAERRPRAGCAGRPRRRAGRTGSPWRAAARRARPRPSSAVRYGRSERMACQASQTKMMRASSGIASPARPSG